MEDCDNRFTQMYEVKVAWPEQVADVVSTSEQEGCMTSRLELEFRYLKHCQPLHKAVPVMFNTA
jgi:hypothetical protein